MLLSIQTLAEQVFRENRAKPAHFSIVNIVKC